MFTETQNRERLRTLILAAAGVAGLMTASPSHADIGQSYVYSLDTDRVVVESDGKDYTKLENNLAKLHGDVRIYFDAQRSGRVKRWSVWLTAQVPGGAIVQFRDTPTSQYYPSGDRPRRVEKTIQVSTAIGEIAPFAVGHCNLHAEKLRSQGNSDETIFGEDQVLAVEVGTAHSYEMTGAPGINDAYNEVMETVTFDLICQAAPPVQHNPTRNPQIVEAASLSIVEQADIRGNCRLNLSGVIETKEPNTEVSFRYRDDKGKTSDLKTVSSDHTGTAMFNHPYDLATDGHNSGQVRIDGDNFHSAWADYAMDCQSVPGDFKTAMPPKLRVEISTAETRRFPGKSCPSKVWLAGHIDGRGEVSGIASMVGKGYLSGFHPYSVTDGSHQVILASRDLTWNAATLAQGTQTFELNFNAANPDGDLIATAKRKHYTVTCQNVAVNGGHAPASGFAPEQDQQQGARPLKELKPVLGVATKKWTPKRKRRATKN